VIIDGVPETPYKCFGGTIFAMQMGGVKQIGFISEPPGE
jgi:biopolymer transport protein ExbD